MINRFLITIILSINFLNVTVAQTILNADNTPNNTYELINSVLAPGGTAEETPDQAGGTHAAFGRHIAEVFDTDLNKNVFEFYLHVAEDNDKTGGLVRQRVEIKTYASSPAKLKGTLGETIVYKWRFKIPVGFQPSSSFTHIHQVKAVDGDDGAPMFTLTPRKGTLNKLELIYVKDSLSGTDKKVTVNLSLFEGIWVEATETIKIGINGTYSMSIVKVSDGTAVLSYSASDIQTFRTGSSFIRPKWGIYRSLKTPSDLRDEAVRFSDISIEKIPLRIILKLDDFSASNNISAATPTLDYLISKQLKAGIGFIAQRNDATALSVYSPYLNANNIYNERLFEVWHHGLDHIKPEFDATTYAYQKSHFEQADSLIKGGLRVQMHSFGAPYNQNDANTNTIISENSNYKVTMFNNPAANVSTGIINLTNRVNMENGTGNPDYSYFVNNYNTYKSSYTDLMVLQGHPNLWTSTQLAQFRQIIDFLIAEGVKFVTPYEYYLSLNPLLSVPITTQTISFPSLPTKLKNDVDFDAGATSNSSLAVTYNSSNPSVSTIVNGKIHIVGTGSSIITASQMGNTTYKSADYVSRILSVSPLDSLDYRSLASGNWNIPATWQSRANNGSWATAAIVPSASSNVFIQSGHTITLDAADANCDNLNINANTAATAQGRLDINGAFSLNINGKIRAYSGAAVTSSVDGTYSGISTTTLVANMITTNAAGVLKFIGGTRNITESGEWNSATINPNAVFALNNGVTGSLVSGMKFRNVTFMSGTISGVGLMAATSSVTINNGAKFTTSRTTQAISSSSGSPTPTLTLDIGGTLELTGDTPEINCTTFNNNGTVIYSGGASQNFAVPNAAILTNNPATTSLLNNYNNLTIAPSGIANLAVNRNYIVSGSLTLTNGKLIIPPTSTLELTNANSAIFGGNSSNYIQTLADGVGTGGLLKVTGLSTSKSFPLGSATNYLPVTLNPVSTSNFSINVFTGATQDATPNGTGISDKTEIVDAIYNINRTSGSGNCDVTLGWDAAIEGNTFATTADNQIGAAQYNSGSYGSFTGIGDNSTNRVVISGVSTFAPFLIGKNKVLPVTLTSFTAQKQSTEVQLTWNTDSEQNNSHFDVQRSLDNVQFFSIGRVNGAGNSNASIYYYLRDKSPASGTNYYCLNQVDFDGKTSISKPISVNMGFRNACMQVYASAGSLSNLNIIISTEQASAGQLIIYNIGGQKVYEKAISLNRGKNDLSISLSNMDKGIFIATYNNGSQVLKKKFFK